MSNESSFTVKVTMGDRWVPQFLGLLREMERLGRIGSSRALTFYSDGDGDFHPRFEWDTDVEPVDAVKDLTWDAG
jgi:hypothetical protein